jgi:hypothetical protein
MGTRYPDSRNRRSIEDGDAFEQFVVDVMSAHGMPLTRALDKANQFQYGDTLEGVEIKLDARSEDTKRLSIEVAERTALERPWVASGIFAASQATRYAHGCRAHFWVFPVRGLRAYYEQNRPPTIDTNPPTIRRFYLSFTLADVLADLRFRQGKRLHLNSFTAEECDLWLFANGWTRNTFGRWVSPEGRIY